MVTNKIKTIKYAEVGMTSPTYKTIKNIRRGFNMPQGDGTSTPIDGETQEAPITVLNTLGLVEPVFRIVPDNDAESWGIIADLTGGTFVDGKYKPPKTADLINKEFVIEYVSGIKSTTIFNGQVTHKIVAEDMYNDVLMYEFKIQVLADEDGETYVHDTGITIP